MQSLWNTIFYEPVYNALIFTINHITFGNIGLAVIVLTIFVKLILSPLTKKSIKSQILMKRMEPELKKIKKDYPNKEEQARKTFELYKKYGTNPFSGCLVVILQLPVIFALYFVFMKDFAIDSGIIYSFIQIPSQIHTNFLGLIEIGSRNNLFLGLLTGVTQFIQGYLSSPASVKPKMIEIVKEKDVPTETKTFQEELASSMQINVRYILPVIIAFIAWKLSAAVALYWITSNIFTIVQEWYIRRSLNASL